jgi:hemerythrin
MQRMFTLLGVVMALIWTEHLSVGNGLIDSDHKNLIVVVNSMEQAIGRRDRAAVSKSFVLLDTYIAIHCRNEEKIAEAINFPFTQSKFEHRQLMHEMRYMVEKLESNVGLWPDSLLERYSNFLSSWMTDHIIKTDMKMKPALQAYPYDFRPA